MQAGTPYAVSFEYSFSGGLDIHEFQLWGTTARCGSGTTATLLANQSIADGNQIACFDVTPTESYSHVILVYRFIEHYQMERSFMALGGAEFCPTGSCPR
jgi:hypothetical protein